MHAGLFYAALGGKVASVTLRDAPVSYLFDNRESVDFFSMAIHLPGFLNVGNFSINRFSCGVIVAFNSVAML